MSESIYVVPSRSVIFGDVMEQLELLENLHFNTDAGEPIGGEEPWPMISMTFHRFGSSTRPVEVHHTDEAFRVRILSLSSSDDRFLASIIANEIAAASGGVVRREDGTLLESLDDYEDPDKGYSSFVSDAEIAASQIENRGAKLVTINGPERDFFLGPRTLREMRSAGDYPQRLLDAILRVQYMDRSDFMDASVFTAKFEDGAIVRMSVWNAGPPFLFQGVDQLSLLVDGSSDKSELLSVPYAALPELAGNRFSWLHERQSMVQTFTDSEWPSVIQRARRYASVQTDRRPGDQPRKNRKGWWPF